MRSCECVGCKRGLLQPSVGWLQAWKRGVVDSARCSCSSTQWVAATAKAGKLACHCLPPSGQKKPKHQRQARVTNSRKTTKEKEMKEKDEKNGNRLKGM